MSKKNKTEELEDQELNIENDSENIKNENEENPENIEKQPKTNESSESQEQPNKNNDWKESYLRLMAEFENYKRRTQKEKAEIIKFANENLLEKFLPVIDDFKRTQKAIGKTDNLAKVKEGIDLVSEKFYNTLSAIGLQPIKTIGEKFDSNFQEAITTIPVQDDSQKGVVIDEAETGYTFNGKVIRYAKVIVGEDE